MEEEFLVEFNSLKDDWDNFLLRTEHLNKLKTYLKDTDKDKFLSEALNLLFYSQDGDLARSWNRTLKKSKLVNFINFYRTYTREKLLEIGIGMELPKIENMEGLLKEAREKMYSHESFPLDSLIPEYQKMMREWIEEYLDVINTPTKSAAKITHCERCNVFLYNYLPN